MTFVTASETACRAFSRRLAVFTEGSNVLFRVRFESRIVLEKSDKFGTMTFSPPVVVTTTKTESGVTGHDHWFHIHTQGVLGLKSKAIGGGGRNY